MPESCAPGVACDKRNFICFFGLAPGLSSEPALVSSPPNDFSKDIQLLVATGNTAGAPQEVFLESHGSLSANQIVFPQKVSIHLLNSVLTL